MRPLGPILHASTLKRQANAEARASKRILPNGEGKTPTSVTVYTRGAGPSTARQ